MTLLKPRFSIPAQENRAAFRSALGSWFAKNGKDYPWRRTKDPYAILVSEMMLQQTRLATVLDKGYYTRFLQKFPTSRSLAAAEDQNLLKAWEGLGYYRRARMLRSAAQAVEEKFNGIFPDTERELLALPGIGPYTVAALLSFAFDKPSGLVDGNVSRVLSRITDDHTPIDSTPTIRAHRQLAHDLCDPNQPRNHNYAMMELGQTICRPGVPHCEICPISGFCKTQEPSILPVKKPRAKTTKVSEHAIWATDPQNRILLHKEAGERRTGLWKLPIRTEVECEGLEAITVETYPITRYIVTLTVYQASEESSATPLDGDQWIPIEDLDSLPLAAPFRRAIEHLLSIL
ncbi:A/G-specific adenine glycosylase [Luteolibacter sp. AS25]|uniref:A/G-specific adenine glycosylase n=1 Tax=Luteolibacter sp. AS25 TaxID=3135776 RepID=UPI00398A6B67